mgnify:CR=1 FL=1|jgi:hypothetical protein
MKLKTKYRIYLQLFVMTFLLYSCSENETSLPDTGNNQARLSFLIKTTSVNAALINGDKVVFQVWLFIYSIKQTSAVNIRN